MILWSGLFYWALLEYSKYIMNECPELHLLIQLPLQRGNAGKTPKRSQSSRLEIAPGRNTKKRKRLGYVCKHTLASVIYSLNEKHWKSSLHTCIYRTTFFHLLGYQRTMEVSKHFWYPAQAPHWNWCNPLNSTGNRFFTSIYTLPRKIARLNSIYFHFILQITEGLRSRGMLHL